MCMCNDMLISHVLMLHKLVSMWSSYLSVILQSMNCGTVDLESHYTPSFDMNSST